MVIVQNNSTIPDIPSGWQLLECEGFELTQGSSFDDPTKAGEGHLCPSRWTQCVARRRD